MTSISSTIGSAGKSIVDLIVRALSAIRVHPNLITFAGFLVSIGAAVAFATGAWRTAAIIVICAGLFDILDGAVARNSKTVTNFGAFFDSVLDRYGDISFMIGLMFYYMSVANRSYVLITSIAMLGTIMVSYTRARAESLIPVRCRIGFLERPERLVLLIIGSLSHRMEAVLWVILVLSHLTVVGRVYFTWKELQSMEKKK